jgi:hypothetical protein
MIRRKKGPLDSVFLPVVYGRPIVSLFQRFRPGKLTILFSGLIPSLDSD